MMFDVEQIERALSCLTAEQLAEVDELIGMHEEVAERMMMESSFAEFCRVAWEVIEPGTRLAWNWHLDVICAYLEAVADGMIKRLIINVPPGCMKSILVSVMFPAWMWIARPQHRFLAVTNEKSLALRDAVRMRLLVGSDWYQEKWPLRMLREQDEKSLFANECLGHRQSIGIDARVTGKRGDTIILDDPHDAKRAYSDVERKSVLLSYDQGLSNRLNDPEDSSIVLIMQRLHQQDLTGHLLRKTELPWTHLAIPMEFEGKATYDAGKDIGRPELNDPRKKIGQLMFPERFGPKVIAQEKQDKGDYGYAGQYQQRPIPLEGGILKARWWRRWPARKALPEIEHVFYSWDTAFTEEDMKKGAHSAFLKWGIFWDELDDRYALILLKRWNGQVGYPDLRARAKAEQEDGNPDAHLIEKKASGQSLIQDLRRAGVKVRSHTPTGDKIERAYLEASLLQAGLVYAPERKWADEVIEWIADFPNGVPPSADYTDVFTQTLQYLRKGWWLSHPDDEDRTPPPARSEDDEFEEGRKPRGRAYGS